MAAGVKEDIGIPKSSIYYRDVAKNLYISPEMYMIIGTFNPKGAANNLYI
jgi:hypothetical protein